MARPKEQTKRRDQLIAAASSAVLRHGASGLRLADIAEEAGLTSASVLYYYPDVRELYTAAFAQGGEEYIALREAHVQAADSPEAKLAACMRSGIPWPGHAEETSRLLYELTPVVLRNDAAAAEHVALIARQAALYERVLRECEASGRFRLRQPAGVLARGFVALEEGFGVDVLVGELDPELELEWLDDYARVMVVAADHDEELRDPARP
ncbi:TetR/AcrR family transcriptional regulator [Streptomyces bacillaris]|uniref:TetR/AcrR family transcriptional regulator n=1 Tax=Streptomyces bacillaris TaxID=68179 RepID=UPI0036DDC908